MVAVHAVKMTIPTQGSRMSFVHQARLAHSLRTARGGGRKGRTRQHGRGRKRAKGRERARSRRGGRRAHARAQAVRARGGHKRREHAILSGLTLRAGHVTRADGGGVRDPPPVKRHTFYLISLPLEAQRCSRSTTSCATGSLGAVQLARTRTRALAARGTAKLCARPVITTSLARERV